MTGRGLGRTRTPPGASGRGCAPVPSLPFWRRGLSERSEFRSPHHRDRGTGTPSWGPRPGANGFGFFCRNKRLVLSGAEGNEVNGPREGTSSCGGETPQKKRQQPWMPDQAGHDRRRIPAPSFRHSRERGNPGPFAITNETQGKDKATTLDPRSGSGMTEETNAASWRLRAGLGPGPVHFIWGRGLSERSEFRSPHHRDRGTGTPLGPRPGANGFGSFCRNKRLVLSGAEGSLAKEPRRAGAKPRRRKGNDPGCPIGACP